MAKIALFLPANSFHSFLIENRWQEMDGERLGLDVIGSFGIPVTTSHQGLDFDLCPYLLGVLQRHRSISFVNAPLAHPLIPLTDESHQKWEMSHVYGNLPITFFPEFHTPEDWAIPTEFFFHLASQTTQYSLQFGQVVQDPEISDPIPIGTIGVRYGKKIGIILDGFGAFNKAWFAFGSNPSSSNLSRVMQEIECLVKDPRSHVVIPMDLEQPWVGSAIGSEMFRMFFEELIETGLHQHVVPMTEVMEAAKAHAVKINAPHRILTKWTTHMVQLRYLQRLARIQPRGNKQHLLYALASSSDLLSSWNRYVQRSNGSATSIICRDADGVEIVRSNAHNPHLQMMCLEACNALEHPEQLSFAKRLARMDSHNGLTLAVQKMAERTEI